MTPSNHLNGMTPDHVATHMFVDAAFIRTEILVHGQTHHHGALCKQLVLDLLECCQYLQTAWLAVVFCVLLRFIYTAEGARSISILIRHALLRGNPFSLEEINSVDKQSPRAAVVFKVACHHVLRSEGHINLSV